MSIPSSWELMVLYLLIVALSIAVAHRLTHERWAKHERSRITIGVVCTVLPAFMVGDGVTVAIVFVGFCVAGAVTVSMDHEHERRKLGEVKADWNK